MQLEATTQDSMGHKTIEPKRPEHSKVKFWGLNYDLTTY